jgi:hypothetical protein
MTDSCVMSTPRDPSPPRPPSHIGLVTHVLEDAMEDLGRRFDLDWGTPRTVVNGYVTPTGHADWTIRVVNSSGPIAIELIEGAAGSLWATTKLFELHHYAFWSRDLAADVAALERKEYQVELTVAGDGKPRGFAYLVRPGSARLELIERRPR